MRACVSVWLLSCIRSRVYAHHLGLLVRCCHFPHSQFLGLLWCCYHSFMFPWVGYVCFSRRTLLAPASTDRYITEAALGFAKITGLSAHPVNEERIVALALLSEILSSAPLCQSSAPLVLLVQVPTAPLYSEVDVNGEDVPVDGASLPDCPLPRSGLACAALCFRRLASATTTVGLAWPGLAKQCLHGSF